MTALEISATDARELTDRIKVGVDAIWELIKQAYTSRAWSVLGYSSWDDYCTREFGTSRIRLPREERQEVVASMREIGMSTRAIAAATGVSKGSVQNSLAAGAQNCPPDPAPVTGTDGKTYSPRSRFDPELDARTNAVEDAAEELAAVDFDTNPADYSSKFSDLVEAEANRREVVPGITADELDALNAPEPENHNTVDPQKPRRRSLADQYWGATLELKKAIDRMEKLANDDRFTKQKGQIADANLPDLTRSADDLNKIITQLKRG